MSHCPSCGREIGSHVTCPYCGANLKRRLTLTLFGILAIVLAIGGLALLYVASINSTIPTLRIGQIQAAMNYAYVRIEGIVKRSPSFNPDSETLSFWIDDDSGRMLVSAFRAEARALVAAERVPSIGDRVAVEGTLRVRDDIPSLSISDAGSLELTRAIDAAEAHEIDAIGPVQVLHSATVRGQVRAVREPYGGLRLITVRDATGEIDVVIDADIGAFGPPAPAVQMGDSIEVTGVVTLFDDTPQLTLTRGDRLTVLNQPFEIAELRPILDVGDEAIGDWVRVQGTIARVTPFASGVKFTLSDTRNHEITLLLWRDVFDALSDAADWQIGAQVTAQGPVSAFRGELEIVPELPLDVALLARAVAENPSPTLKLTPIGALTARDINRTVFISGTIQSVDRFTSGARFRVEDDTGSIMLVLFDNVLEQVEDNTRLEEGAGVSALWRVDEFNGALEIIPPNGASVRVALGPERASVAPTAQSSTPPPPSPTLAPARSATPSPSPTLVAAELGATPISAIDASRVGQVVAVRGQVIAAASFSAGFRFTLNDGSGSIALVLFDGIYREVSNRSTLNLGAQVAVEATIVEFNGAFELQPATGRAVTIEQPGSSTIVKTRAVNTLTASDIGSLAAVVGDVLRVEGFSAGVSVFVNDGTGELRVVIFNNVLNYVPDAPSLQAGAKLRVTGRVDLFNDALELVPALGYDVVINP